jgi:O-antigen/teichoic acid export membrane protein
MAVKKSVVELLKFAMALEVAFGVVGLFWALALSAAAVYLLTYLFGPIGGAVFAALSAAYIAIGYSTVFFAYRAIKRPELVKPSTAILWSKAALIAAAVSALSANLPYAASSALLALALYLYAKELAKSST